MWLYNNGKLGRFGIEKELKQNLNGREGLD